MKNLNLKIYLSGIILGILILAAIFFLFKEIQKDSQQLFSQKKELILFEQRSEDLGDLQKKYKKYQGSLEKIESFFVDPALPIELIEFLEKSAIDSQGKTKVSLTKEIKEPEPALSLSITFAGSFSNLLKFIDKLENGPYLIEIINLNVKKLDKATAGNITANLGLIVLAK